MDHRAELERLKAKSSFSSGMETSSLTKEETRKELERLKSKAAAKEGSAAARASGDSKQGSSSSRATVDYRAKLDMLRKKQGNLPDT